MRSFVALALWPSLASAVPVTFSLQGRLLAATGAPVAGPATLTVTLHTLDTGGTTLFTDTFAGESLDDGRFSVVLGSAPGNSLDNTLFLANPDVWVQTAVNGVALGARQRVLGVPISGYAHTAGAVPTGAGAPCGSGVGAGGLRYDNTAGLQVCDGSAWTGLASLPDGTVARPAQSCRTLHDDYPSKPSTTYYISPTGGAPFQVYCNMVDHGGGWTLVMVSSAGGGACRSTVIAGASTGTAPLDPTATPSNAAYMFSSSLWNAIKDPAGTRPGLWMHRRNQGSKWGRGSCTVNTGLPAVTSGPCLDYTLTYSDTPTWSTGSQPAPTNSNCLAYSGGSNVQAGCFYDSANCNDAWGNGNTDVTNYWVR